MKKLLLLVAVVTALTSCKKDWVCEVEKEQSMTGVPLSEEPGVKSTQNHYIPDTKKSTAEEACAQFNTDTPYLKMTGTLK